MDRRKFFCRVSGATAVAAGLELNAAQKPAPKQLRSVNYDVKGFTCITCAVGLEVMLRGLKGVAGAKASYPANKVSIKFDERVIAEEKVRKFIGECGFSVA